MPIFSNDAELIANNSTDFTSNPSDTETKQIKKRKKKSKKKAIDADESILMNIAEEESIKTETLAADEDSVPNETSGQPDNLVLKKLLRGPRYFDPPETSWGSCYNCGEQGHKTGDCTVDRRKKKACYYCGSTEHSFKNCKKGQNCFNCKTGGHKAKDCPERNTSLNNGVSHDKICLKCGDSGHDMFSCKNQYFAEDLMAIQCYVCNDFGHLCCHSSTDHIAKEVSCFKCGTLGHTGLACKRLVGEMSGTTSPTLCYNCGEGGHFARECPNPTPLKTYNKSRKETVDRASSSCHSCGKEGHYVRDCPSSLKARLRLPDEFHGGNLCHNCGVEGHFARECPVMSGRHSDSEMSFRNKKIKFDEDGMATYSEPHFRRGWTTEHPADSHMPSRKAISSRKRVRDPTESPPYYKQSMSSRASPATPASWRHQIHPIKGGQTSGSKYYKNNYRYQSDSSDFNGSADQSYHQRFPASRFYTYSNNSRGKSNDWW